jgi:5-methylcytosine-specific restriction endonuclease McrA
MPMQRSRYPKDWESISLSIRERDAWRCVFCGAQQGQPHPLTGSRVVLTVAHLHDPNPMNCAQENLGSLCQSCHNRLDAPMRAIHARKTRTTKRIAQAAAAGQMPMWHDHVSLETVES